MSLNTQCDVHKNNEVNGIPTAYYFKKRCGRTGPFSMKRTDSDINAIAEALKKLETYRHIANIPAVGKLRAVRKSCYRFKNRYGKPNKAQDARVVDQLKAALDDRIDRVATAVMGAGRDQNIMDIDERIFEGFYTDVQSRHAGGPGRSLHKSYQLERATIRHVPGSKTKDWLDSNSKLTLNDWLDTVHKWDNEDSSIFLNQSYETKGVEYLDAIQRQGYEIRIQGGRVTNSDGSIAHTGNMRSITLGPGWGIFVVSFGGQFYLGEHTVGEFHHSSFLSGSPVLAAGEIAINNGAIVGLTNKTGHYKSREEELNRVLTMFSRNGVDINDIAVQDPFRKPNQWFKGADAIAVKSKLATLGDSTATKPNVAT